MDIRLRIIVRTDVITSRPHNKGMSGDLDLVVFGCEKRGGGHSSMVWDVRMIMMLIVITCHLL